MFAHGQLVKRELHSNRPRLGVSEDSLRWATVVRVYIPRGRPPFGFLGPHADVYLVRQILKTVEESFNHTRTRLRPSGLNFKTSASSSSMLMMLVLRPSHGFRLVGPTAGITSGAQ